MSPSVTLTRIVCKICRSLLSARSTRYNSALLLVRPIGTREHTYGVDGFNCLSESDTDILTFTIFYCRGGCTNDPIALRVKVKIARVYSIHLAVWRHPMLGDERGEPDALTASTTITATWTL